MLLWLMFCLPSRLTACFVPHDALIDSLEFLSDPRPFFNQLLTRVYRGRVMLAPHLHGPTTAQVPAAVPEQLLSRLSSSLGLPVISTAICNAAKRRASDCPVIAGEPSDAVACFGKASRPFSSSYQINAHTVS